MAAEGKKIAVGVFCADWRLHQDGVHINNAVKEYLGVDAVDVLAVAGPDGITNPGREKEKEALEKNLNVLIGAHHPVALAFVAHYKCAGHPVSDEEHDHAIEQTMQDCRENLGFKGETVALVATYLSDTQWPLKEVARIAAQRG